MNKIKNIYLLIIAVVSLSVTGCADWLDVDPIDKTLEDKQFSDEQSIDDVLNGFYIGMVDANLYGGQLTTTTIENLAHYYYVPSLTTTANQTDYQGFFNIQTYQYEQSDVEARFENIWSNAYKIILRINVFINNVENNTFLSEGKKALLLGEAHALRAFIHFDLFRLFGPIYAINPSAESIPYNDSELFKPYANLPANEFVQNVLGDISKAKKYLENDPILQIGVAAFNSDLTTIENFDERLRNRRFNIIAVNAFEARVLQYIGRDDDAANAAKQVIDLSAIVVERNNRPIFNWVGLSTVGNSGEFTFLADRNYIFQSEVLFGIENPSMYRNWTNNTVDAVSGRACHIALNHLRNNIFNISSDGSISSHPDIRIRQWKTSAGSESQYYSVKYWGFGLPATNFIYSLQPLIRISEMYYIIAENHARKGEFGLASQTINEVLLQRNFKSEELNDAYTEAEFKTLLEKEYYREFFGEGQAFFFHKRNQSSRIFDSTGGGNYVEIEQKSYVIPLPRKELND